MKRSATKVGVELTKLHFTCLNFLELTFAGAISLAGQRLVDEVSLAGVAVNGFSASRGHFTFITR